MTDPTPAGRVRPAVSRPPDGVWRVTTPNGQRWPFASWRGAVRFALLWSDLHAAGAR